VAVHFGAQACVTRETQPARLHQWQEERINQQLRQPRILPAESPPWFAEQLENHNIVEQPAQPVRRAPGDGQVMSIMQAQNVRLRAAVAAPDNMLAPDVCGRTRGRQGESSRNHGMPQALARFAQDAICELITSASLLCAVSCT